MAALTDSKLSVLQVSTADLGGGAERVARNLFESYRARGHQSWLAVGTRRTADPDILHIPNFESRSAWTRLWLSKDKALRQQETQSAFKWGLRRALATVGDPARGIQHWLGHEDFNHPGSRRIIELAPSRPQIVHAHNLHGAYFDLRMLAKIGADLPLLLTLHDGWLLSGHCAHSFECERWTTGCGECPDLSIYPAILRDATAHNWKVKRDIYSRTRLYVASPCQWLLDRVGRSMLRDSVIQARVIPNGIDLGVFRPMDRAAAREKLGLPQDAVVLLFVAAGTESNIWKDFKTLRSALSRIGQASEKRRLILIALGEAGVSERIGSAEVRHIPFQRTAEDVAGYYAASDLYLHAARADTFPNAVLEAMACGIPVVASQVGGIPEQVRHGETGFLVPSGDPEAMAARVLEVLERPDLRSQMGLEASRVARERFDLQDQVSRYLDWYREIIAADAD